MVEDDDLDYEFDSSDEAENNSGDNSQGLETVTMPVLDTSNEIDKQCEVVAGDSAPVIIEDNLDEERLLESNPQLARMLNKLLDKRLGAAEIGKQCSSGGKGRQPEMVKNTAVLGQAISINTNMNKNIKSPSDTTIYTPALKRQFEVKDLEMHLNNISGRDGLNGQRMQQGSNVVQPVPVQISDFVEAVRRDTSGSVNEAQKDQSRQLEARPLTSCGPPPEFDAARQRVQDSVLEVEWFKAALNDVPGNSSRVMNEMPNLQNFLMHNSNAQNHSNIERAVRPDMVVSGQQFPSIPDIGSGVSDDDFFHLTCHIEPSLIHKIEKGEFVELEKLLPKSGNFKNSDDNRLELVQRDGGTYLVPANRDNKIMGIRHWEQAFRAYATIYCGANPHRLKEIWQYITVINMAAASYSWENVYNYDIMFRHLILLEVGL